MTGVAETRSSRVAMGGTTTAQGVTIRLAATTITRGTIALAETGAQSMSLDEEAAAHVLPATVATTKSRTGEEARVHTDDLDMKVSSNCPAGMVQMCQTYRSSCSPTSTATL